MTNAELLSEIDARIKHVDDRVTTVITAVKLALEVSTESIEKSISASLVGQREVLESYRKVIKGLERGLK